MTPSFKAMTLIPLTVLVAGCVAGDGDRVDTPTEIEQTLDTDIDGDGTIVQNGVEVAGAD
ncbi:hypothetical protein [Jannaschia sp. M317]|uniref:hypothetical protein n=1 Tax=Jannaschia sp. M317 TaxID=2867011 RepID=UPI0021A801EA|nr:hypothetical protein [Jannaschia sp. M317]UWQ18009.1 hypothetical protein K3551_01495 [Jannaschia sp. M317]